MAVKGVKQDAFKRFMAKVWPCPTTGCWLWDGKVNAPTGYGHFWLDEKTIGAHVASWKLHGRENPDRLHVLHTCDLRCCVNPGHLFLGTCLENMADMVAKGRAAGLRRKGTSHPLAKVDESIVLSIRRADALGARQCDLAVQHGLSRQSIRGIVIRRTWRHV